MDDDNELATEVEVEQARWAIMRTARSLGAKLGEQGLDMPALPRNYGVHVTLPVKHQSAPDHTVRIAVKFTAVFRKGLFTSRVLITVGNHGSKLPFRQPRDGHDFATILSAVKRRCRKAMRRARLMDQGEANVAAIKNEFAHLNIGKDGNRFVTREGLYDVTTKGVTLREAQRMFRALAACRA